MSTSTIRPVLVAGLLSAAVLVMVGLGSAPVAAAEPVATMSISPSRVTAGQAVTVSVAGWPEGTVNAAVCGSRPSQGVGNCDRVGASIEVAADGSGSTTLTFDPAVGCPCVVEVTTRDGRLVQNLPIEEAAAATTTTSVAVGFVGRDETVRASSWSDRTWIIVLLGVVTVLVVLAVLATGWRPGARRRAADRDTFIRPGDDELAGR